MNRAFDAVVIGAGPAGIAAATRAAEARASVLLVDESAGIGGQIWRHRPGAPVPRAASAWFRRLRASTADVRTSTTVFDAAPAGDEFEIAVETNGSAARVRARSIVIATGARERFVPFPGWTLPGVIGVGGAQALLKTGASFAGMRVVVAGSGPLLLPVAAAMSNAGARVQLVAEQARTAAVMAFAAGLWRRPTTLWDAARYRGAFWRARYPAGTWVREARGGPSVERVVVTNGATSREIECDVLCTAFGLIPSLEVPRLLGCDVTDGAVRTSDDQMTSIRGVYAAGETTGVGGVDLSLIEGEIAGLSVAGRMEEARRLVPRRQSLRALAAAMDAAFALRDELRTLATPHTIVCRCEDVRLDAIDPAWSAREAKLYARVGMGPCQGRVCGAALAFLRDWTADSSRLPVTPTALASLAQEAP